MRFADAISAGAAVGIGTMKRPGKMVVQPGVPAGSCGWIVTDAFVLASP